MCWSKYEREEWERLAFEREVANLRTISTEPEVEKPAPAEEVEEREGELVRV